MIMKAMTVLTATLLMLQTLRQLSLTAGEAMAPEVKMRLAGTGSGRIALHVLCAWRDHRFAWHWRGVAREFALG
jgi:hypothetical protein